MDLHATPQIHRLTVKFYLKKNSNGRAMRETSVCDRSQTNEKLLPRAEPERGGQDSPPSCKEKSPVYNPDCK